MRALSALDAALEQGGWNYPQNANRPESEIREYFTEENFRNMFGPNECDDCGGYSLDECAAAVIEWQTEASEC